MAAKTASGPLELKRRRRRTGIIVGIVALAIIAGLSAFAIWHGIAGQDDGRSDIKTRTAKVERTSLVAGFKLSGTLGYGDPVTLGGGGGVVTKLPEVGQTIPAGGVVMEVEGAPVFILQAAIPLWRNIGPGTVGVDVAMARDALISLGINAGEAGNQTYDQALSNGIATLYANAGYQSLPLTSEQQQNAKAAQEALTSAQNVLSDAKATLANASKSTATKSQLIQADAAVNEAQSRLNIAKSKVCPSADDPAFDPTCTPDSLAADIQAAQDAVNLAVAQRDELKSPPDTSAQQQAVNQAQQGVDQAQAAYDQAVGNTLATQFILVVPEKEIRVDSVTAKLGVAADGPVLAWTRTLLYGKVELTDAQRALLATGTVAELTLSDGSTLEGTVGDITDSKTDPSTGMITPATARIDLADQAAAAAVGVSAVSVTFVQDTAEDTLVVPVTALMALSEGGYCVQRPDGSLVGVEVGLVADTRVQVKSDQLKQGDEVIVP
ncbi:MAG: hypothetical protein LBV30_00145 [Propionibacteriaceae bacterium]|jgi:hypothetical protein|nr:hypothetical protein [Propionibacteriaceae bacterium]